MYVNLTLRLFILIVKTILLNLNDYNLQITIDQYVPQYTTKYNYF